MIEPLDGAVDHVRGPAEARLIDEYGDYECPYSRQAFREIERVDGQIGHGVRFAFRHCPLTGIHPHALSASVAAEAAARQDRFWAMHELLVHRQHALAHSDLRRYAGELGLEVARFDLDRTARRCSSAFAATCAAAMRRVRCAAHRRCSSTESCTAAGTPRPLCSRRSRDERNLPAPRRHTIGREYLKWRPGSSSRATRRPSFALGT